MALSLWQHLERRGPLTTAARCHKSTEQNAKATLGPPGNCAAGACLHPSRLGSAENPGAGPSPGYLDDDWRLDAAFKASRGIWIGRDVIFTHGPLFQWLSSLPARSMGVSTGAIYATWNTVPIWCTIVFVWLTLWLLIPEQPPWKRFLLLLLLCVFWSPSLRMSCVVLLFALFLRGGYAVVEMRVKPYAAGALSALLCAIAFLLAADTGVYGVAALLTAVIGVALESRRDSARCAKNCFCATVGCCVFRSSGDCHQCRDGHALRFSILAGHARRGRHVPLGHAVFHETNWGDPFVRDSAGRHHHLRSSCPPQTLRLNGHDEAERLPAWWLRFLSGANAKRARPLR